MAEDESPQPTSILWPVPWPTSSTDTDGDRDTERPGDDELSPAADWVVTYLPRVALAAALLFLAAAVGYFAGTREGRRPGPGSVEVGFLHDMIAHHEQALELSIDELTRGTDPAAKTFAREILLFQSYEIGVMERQLEHWGYARGTQKTAMAWMGHAVDPDEMPGLASPSEIDALTTATGRDADALFIALMRDHHAGGVHMATAAATMTENRFVKELAQRMASNQRAEIAEMARARDRAGLPANPPGFSADPLPAAMPGAHPDH